MKHLTGFVILASALLLVGCETLKPEDYGFRRVAISGQENYCAPRDWVVPPIVAADAANDPYFTMYTQFTTLPNVYLASGAHSQVRVACISPAQWGDWLTMRRLWNRDWALTPGMAETLAAQRDNDGPLQSASGTLR